MKAETKKEIKDTINTILLCAVAIVVVLHLRGTFGKNISSEPVIKESVKPDSVKPDSTITVKFVREQMLQQKAR